MNSTQTALTEGILTAGSLEEVLSATALTPRELYARLHPDRFLDPDAKIKAGKAFARLQELQNAAKRRAEAKFEVTSKKRTYHASGLYRTGNVSNLYRVAYERDGDPKAGLLKLPRSPRDNDLIGAEASALKKLWATGDDRLPFINRFEDYFRQKDARTGVIRHAVVVRRLPGFISLREVLDAFPAGLEARDLAWIWRRALVATSLLADNQIVHGSLVPEHILIHPKLHGVIICGFTSAVESGQTIKVAGGSRLLLAPEVLDKQPATVATDVYTLHATMNILLSAAAPAQFRAFIKGCTFLRPGVRPTDPLRLLQELDELLVRLYGPRKFRVFPDIPGWSE